MTGLYIHIPFCKKKCRYCDFYSLPSTGELILKYYDVLVNDIKEYASIYKDKHFDTLFIGGGTPTVMGEKLCGIVDTALNSFNFDAKREITIETNPESVNKKLILDLLNVGVNRVSLGIQSFDDDQLKLIGRIHNSDDAIKAIDTIKNAEISNINFDLMFALPKSADDSKSLLSKWENTLDRAFSYNPTHLSAYSLTLEKNTPLYRMENLVYPGEDEEDEMYDVLCSKAKEKGYSHYEISNFAKKGYECKHNLKYWQGEEYLGLGPAAHSYMDGRRFSFEKELAGYIGKHHAPIIYREQDDTEALKEKVMTGLRTSCGILYTDIEKQFDVDGLKKFSKTLESSGLAVMNDKSLILTEKGYRVSNTIINKVLNYMKKD